MTSIQLTNTNRFAIRTGATGVVAQRPYPETRVDPRLTRVLRFIEDHLEDPALGADMLQSVSHVSRPTLYRMFRALGGVSRYIRERRLLAAHLRLRHDPGASITFLLYDLGFESERQFQRAFHAYFGMSPAQWRERCRARQTC